MRPRHWISLAVLVGLAALALLAIEARAADPYCPNDDSPEWQMTAEGIAQDLGRAATPAEVCAYITSHRST